MYKDLRATFAARIIHSIASHSPVLISSSRQNE